MPNAIEQTYVQELKRNWRPIFAAAFGLGTGLSTIGFVTSTLAPHMVRDNGWSTADFAAVTSFSLLNVLAIPMIGRLADKIGVRITALIGLISMPSTYFAFSLIGGSLTSYILVFVVQSLLGMTTTATVFTRLIVQSVARARGVALAIAASGPAIVGAAGAPLLNNYVENYGWRASFQALAVVTLMAAIITLLLLPKGERPVKRADVSPPKEQADYSAVFRDAAFWTLLLSMLLCNLPQVLLLSQLKLLLIDNNISGSGASVMLSAMSLGMITGRFLTGAALDRLDPYIVSCVTLCVPCVGLVIFASSFDAPIVLTGAVFLLGFAFGAEGDVVAFLVARTFNIAIYSSVMGLVTVAITASVAGGALLLSWTLRRTGHFDLFLSICAAAVALGAALLLMVGRAARPAGYSVIQRGGEQLKQL